MKEREKYEVVDRGGKSRKRGRKGRDAVRRKTKEGTGGKKYCTADYKHTKKCIKRKRTQKKRSNSSNKKKLEKG
jgi:hypothetical protein